MFYIWSVAGRCPYDPVNGITYDPVKGITYDPVNGITYDPVNGITYDPVNGITYDPVNGITYDPVNSITYDPVNSITYDPVNGITYDPVNSITSNLSEGFNFLLKDFQESKEAPLDCVLMSLKMLQGYHLEEIRRGKAGLGKFMLKQEFLNFRTDVKFFESKHLVCHPKDIVKALKNKRIQDRVTHFAKGNRIFNKQ